jgi:hypothetical protein
MIESLGTWSYRFVAPYHASKTLPRNQAKPIVISIHAPRHQNLTSSIRTRKNLKTRVTVTVFPFPQLCTAIQIYGQRQFVYVYHARAPERLVTQGFTVINCGIVQISYAYHILSKSSIFHSVPRFPTPVLFSAVLAVLHFTQYRYHVSCIMVLYLLYSSYLTQYYPVYSTCGSSPLFCSRQY